MKNNSMFLVYFSITLAILSSALYHFVAKSAPANVNFRDKLSWVNVAGILVCLAGLVMLNWKR